DVLSAGCRGIVVVDDHGQAVVPVEHGVADTAGESVVPAASIAHDRNRTAPASGVEGGGAGGTEPVPHDAVAHVEGRQRREGMAADIRADVERPRLALQE